MLNYKYRMVLTKIPTDEKDVFLERWFITENKLPVYEINEWLDFKSINKITTGKEYASKLVVFLNYLDLIGENYKEAVKKDIIKFLMYLIYGISLDLTVRSISGQITYSTLSKYITVITEFYKWLDDEQEDINMKMSKKHNRKRVSKSFYYGQIWNSDYTGIIDKHILKLKPSRPYIKWYTEEQKEAILSNFTTLRDKAVFLMTLEGMRIDKALSIKLSQYDMDQRIVKPSRSKGKESQTGDKNDLRLIVLPKATCEILDRYIQTERTDSETESGKLNDWLFINLRKDKYQGDVLKYRSYWGIIKKCAARAGLDPEQIRTHSGRSTKTMELLEHQVLFPEDGITDLIIMETMGWESPESIQPYKNHNNMIIAKAAADKVHRRRGK